jgi:hypothetical protein
MTEAKDQSGHDENERRQLQQQNRKKKKKGGADQGCAKEAFLAFFVPS